MDVDDLFGSVRKLPKVHHPLMMNRENDKISHNNFGITGSGVYCWLEDRASVSEVPWVRPPPTNPDIVGIHRDLNMYLRLCLVVLFSGWRLNLRWEPFLGPPSSMALRRQKPDANHAVLQTHDIKTDLRGLDTPPLSDRCT